MSKNTERRIGRHISKAKRKRELHIITRSRKQQTAIALAGITGSLETAATFTEIPRRTIALWMAEDDRFRREIERALQDHKARLLKYYKTAAAEGCHYPENDYDRTKEQGRAA